MKPALIAAALVLASGPALADPVAYTLDSSHSQVVFSYNHLGFSTTYGMFSGFEGEIMFDPDDPSASSVTVSMPAESMNTGWPKREEHFMSADFFNATVNPDVSFVSTAIEVTGEDTAVITGDLTMNGVTKSVDLDATLNGTGPHPFADGKEWAGFDATTTLLRSEFNMGFGVPAVSDEVEVRISIEAMKAEG
ncbi:MAG: YceI family protein [Pseudomonadota bacterium]